MKKVKVKYVKAANAWCRTTIEYTGKGVKQTIEWFSEKPEENEEVTKN